MARTVREVRNAFSVAEVAKLTNLKRGMIHYLTQQGYLKEVCREDADLGREEKRRTRGNAKFYSFRGLVIAKTIERLLAAGVQLSHLKKALENLRKDQHWVSDGADLPITWLVTDGTKVFLRDDQGYVDLMRRGGQRSFAFVVEVGCIRADLLAGVRRHYEDKVAYCTYVEGSPVYAATTAYPRAARG